MKPEQLMQSYLAECTLHANVLDEGLSDIRHWTPFLTNSVIDKELLRILDQTLRDRSRVVPRSDRACVFTERFLRSENAGFPKSRRVIAITMLHTPCWVCNE